MVSIKLTNANVEFPIFNAKSRSLKTRVLQATTGGTIGRGQDGHVLVKSLNNVTLEITDGERVGLVGHNGAGKTTFLRLVSGIYDPVGGSVQIDGECVSLINIALGIDPEASGRENIRLRAAMMGIQKRELDHQIENIIRFTGLGDFIDMPFRTYSSGMQMRLAFSVSTAVKPEILVMDEWLSTGDSEFQERADKRLADILDKTRILILASHSRDLLLRSCNRLIWLERGAVKMDGDAATVAAQYFG